jgi:allophanate hydrolase subunit 2
MIFHFHPYPGFSHISVLTRFDKNLAARVTAVDGDLATNFSITNTPVDHGYVIVEVNGKLCTVGNGVKTMDCYFSNNGGITARTIVDITAGDTLHWVGSVAKYQLDTNDRISLHYDI